MQRLILLKATPDDPEMAILQVSSQEHATLHKPDAGLKLVNSDNIFSKPATALEMKPDSSTQYADCLVLIVHLPNCTANACCLVI